MYNYIICIYFNEPKIIKYLNTIVKKTTTNIVLSMIRPKICVLMQWPLQWTCADGFHITCLLRRQWQGKMMRNNGFYLILNYITVLAVWKRIFAAVKVTVKRYIFLKN